MNDITNTDQAIELLQGLGLKEYEAKAFVALTRLPKATAKEISDISEVPRTRVYDAVRVLESKGLVEIQHANPQQFRAVGIDEATATLRAEYEAKTDTLRETLEGLEPASEPTDPDATHEVWALSGHAATHSRTKQLIEEGDGEIVMIFGTESVVTDSVLAALDEAAERGVSVVVGTVTESLRSEVETALPGAEVFVSGLEWLQGATPDDDTEITRILLVDRSTILVSTAHETAPGSEEQAVFGRGFDNGLVTIVRRLMATGLLPVEDPGVE
ncbi:TrmB family transcriptional regulator [Halosimplex pelagicum]|uniref:TrmB family transcriptional regulator n=1 Tax=Halosimplex pelagicum TaxID=869886 RepID=A0A7D5PA99_9EURY|nr:TrmB family transcriptional regulator [Halosimplex pelagicum]QLH81665.1 TrmB family transcriptional regulator [Halosimplex pelagicum]